MSTERQLPPRLALAELARRRCMTSLGAFVRAVWPVLNPGEELIWSWHMDAICEHLEAIAERRIGAPGLVINVPPGASKSSIISICYPIWRWLHDPALRFICGSYDLDLARDFNVKRRNIIQSSRFQEMFRPTWRLVRGEEAKGHLGNDAQGWYHVVSVGSGVTGRHADEIIVDDPIHASQIHTPFLREHVIWLQETLSTRFRSLADGVLVLVMQRLHEADAAGALLGEEGGGYEHLCIPAEYDPEVKCATSIGWTDPRTKEGELFFPARFPRVALEARRVSLGSAGYSAQYQQRPTADGGILFREEWFERRLWTRLPSKLGGARFVGAWDCAYEKGEGNDYTVGQVWMGVGPDLYLLDQVRARMEISEMVAAARRLAKAWPQVERWWIEMRSIGPALESLLKRHVRGVRGVKSQDTKEQRVAALAPWVEAGNVRLPAPQAERPRIMAEGKWDLPEQVPGLIAEFVAFPRGRYDDQCDAAAWAARAFRRQVGDDNREERGPGRSRVSDVTEGFQVTTGSGAGGRVPRRLPRRGWTPSQR